MPYAAGGYNDLIGRIIAGYTRDSALAQTISALAGGVVGTQS